MYVWKLLLQNYEWKKLFYCVECWKWAVYYSGNPLLDCLTVAGSVVVASLLCFSCAKTDGVIKRWSALVMRPHSTAQASNGRFVTAETEVHCQGSICGRCGEQSGNGTGFGSPLSQYSTTKTHS